MDINVVLTRAGVFLFVYLFVLGIPFWLGHTTKLWFPSTILAVSLATLGPFIYQSLRRRAEDIILRDQRHYQRALRELSATMTRIRDLPQLTETIASTVVNTVRASFCAFYLKEDAYKAFVFKNCYPLSARSRFRDSVPPESNIIKLLEGQRKPLLGEEIGEQKEINLDSGMIIPVSMEDELFGFMVLGSKPNSQMYTPDDVLVFETLSYSTSLAIENCIFWKEIEDRHRKARLQEMDTYSYSLAHEIDNPMQVVLGHAELLKKDLVESIPDQAKHEEIVESFDFIIEAAKRVSGMVKAIRDFGQKTTGELKPLKVADVVESFSRLYYPQFKDKKVVFEQSIGLKEPVYIRGEKPELMQALVILANNSIHAMTGVTQKKACLRTELVNHEWVRISFGDNGYGIKKEMLEIIFTPFTTTKASSEGTGMGLYNAKKIVERHKGKIWAESEGPGKGAVFVIELPIAKDVNPQDLEDQYKGKRVF
jgi:signal transduction histidine kinase